jgi:SAM-dependent methyltransferase
MLRLLRPIVAGVLVASLPGGVPGAALTASVRLKDTRSTVARRGAILARASRPAGGQPPARTPDIHFVPTRQAVADAMLRLAKVGPADVVYDLGSGDGRIVVLAAQKYGARGVGIELDPQLVRTSREIAREGEVADRVTFIEGDLFQADLSEATIVTLYLSTSVNMRLEPKLRRELRPGTRIVSQRFPIGKWPPDATIQVEGEQLFLGTIPAR